jgi:L-ascorbate metabolism protein UlaG (beta-lactamase superfamily)
MIFILSTLLAFILVVAIFMQQPKFGKLPSGARLARIRQSPNFKNGSFQNRSFTPNFTDGAGYLTVMKDFYFVKHPRVTPVDAIPSTKTNLHALSLDQDVLVWFGHSSYFMQIDGKRMLIDPVFSGHASPFSFAVKAFKGADQYTPDDIPEIDYLFITHDHWDHLDHKTILKLKPKIKTIVCSLGTGAHLEHWGFDPAIIIEKDWNESADLKDGFSVHTVPSRHFAGRGFKRNQALWTSYVLKTPAMQILIGGDSGYDNHFAEIGQAFGPFDLAILENGQYNKNWKHIHMMPHEVLQAAQDLQAKRLFPMHSSKFKLSNHPWDGPLRKITELNKGLNVNIITPMIGEQVDLKDEGQQFGTWWEGVN